MDAYFAIWDRVLSLIRDDIGPTSFDAWFSATEFESCDNDYFNVSVPSVLVKEWIQSRYWHLLNEKINLFTQHPVKLKLIVRTPSIYDYSGNRLNPKYSFDSFVVGNSNRFAHAASYAVAEAPGKAYNPLFIYGGVGLGKTHLMQAIGHHILSKNKLATVVYVSSEQFTNELINSIRDDKTSEFRNKYRNIDILLIDDIQFLVGKERTQEEFFHTFNSLYETNKQIVISSDRPPREIPTLEDRLRSRFEWGLLTDIQYPDLETRIAILKKKAQHESLEVPNDVLLYIATNIQSNIRELEGALTRTVAFARVKNQPITMDTAMEALQNILPPPTPRQITIESIQEAVASYFSITVADLISKRRTRQLAFPRQIAMYLSRELTELSLPMIGDTFGGRDHTTVLHAYDKISRDLKTDPVLEKIINDLKSKIESY
ncbi:MAG: chromosomal replication initiator protein DnaA [Syntrophomonadaceae bacterium]|nr:chromosomal replication initiator protein DnaA [Syntrophomonadaceae bacterium]